MEILLSLFLISAFGYGGKLLSGLTTKTTPLANGQDNGIIPSNIAGTNLTIGTQTLSIGKGKTFQRHQLSRL